MATRREESAKARTPPRVGSRRRSGSRLRWRLAAGARMSRFRGRIRPSRAHAGTAAAAETEVPRARVDDVREVFLQSGRRRARRSASVRSRSPTCRSRTTGGSGAGTRRLRREVRRAGHLPRRRSRAPPPPRRRPRGDVALRRRIGSLDARLASGRRRRTRSHPAGRNRADAASRPRTSGRPASERTRVPIGRRGRPAPRASSVAQLTARISERDARARGARGARARFGRAARGVGRADGAHLGATPS